MRLPALALLLLFAACGPSRGNPACGITALAGATLLLDEFARPAQTLSAAPLGAPEVVAVRVAAGPAYRGLVRTVADSAWIVTLEGELPATLAPKFGVLVVATDGRPRGVMLYDTPRVAGAPSIGSVVVDSLTLPLLGIQTNTAGLEDAKCPFFPDSLQRP
ncbi:MAG TPA: hypothetical protein VFO95_18575 [Gemmatimonadales bacterium]|nr:hypothetical protein [Gemmatimonadales bacterium]